MLKKIRHSQSGYILLSAVFIALFLALLMSAAFLKTGSQLRVTHQRQNVQQAFYAAEAGIDRAIYELRRNPDWQPGVNGNPPVIDERLNAVTSDDSTVIGFYSLEVLDGGFLTNLGESRWVRSVGRDTLSDLPRVIMARILIDDPSRFLLSTPGALRFKSGSQIDADILGKDLYFDVNVTLPEDERMITVNGDVLYINEINPNNPAADPYININGAVERYPSITFPGVDISRYSSLAASHSPLEGYSVDGDLNVDLENLSQLNNDPAFNPMIIYATGDIHISGEFGRSVLIVAGGNIFIEGDIIPDQNAGLSVTPNIGLFAKQDVVIADGVIPAGGDLELEAFVIADGGGSSKGEFRAESSVGLGIFDFKGAISVRGEGGNKTGIDLSIFSVRNYSHNPNLSVPFSPFIANIISWQETDLNAPFPPAIP